MYDDLVGSLEAVPNVGFEDAMTAAIQCGAFYGDEFKFGPAGRAILAQCLQDMNNGAHQGQRIMAARQECVDVANVIRSA